MRTLPDRYATVGRRDFRAALEYLLETEFKLVGSHRVIRLIAEAVVELQRQFYPEYEQLEPGTMLWATTQAGGCTCASPTRRPRPRCPAAGRRGRTPTRVGSQ